MKQQTSRKGKITKLVQIGHAISNCGDETDHNGERSGYGLVRDEDGEEVFFVDSVVIKGRFQELEIGQSVFFELESGPFLRAKSLRAVEWEGIC